VEVAAIGPDPGDMALLQLAAQENRILVTLDSDFARLVYLEGMAHAGLVRLPDVPAEVRISLMADVLRNHAKELAGRAVVTVRGGRIRISSPPSAP
jgi:predicted nuclease of predicted toxin-antitoxin system